MSDIKPDIPRWLAVSAGADTVRLLPVQAPSTGPDVFCKLQDAQAAIDAAVSAAVAADRRKTLLDLWDALPMHEQTGDCAGSLRATLLFSEVGDEIRETRMRQPCGHSNKVEQTTGDGSRVLFCPDCGQNLRVHTFG